MHERACFHQSSQQTGETVEANLRGLYEMAETCEFGTQKDEKIRDRLVNAINDRRVSQSLQMESDLTLGKVVQITRQAELVKTQISAETTSAEVAALYQRSRTTKNYSTGEDRNKDRDKEEKMCSRCIKRNTHVNVPLPINSFANATNYDIFLQRVLAKMLEQCMFKKEKKVKHTSWTVSKKRESESDWLESLVC